MSSFLFQDIIDARAQQARAHARCLSVLGPCTVVCEKCQEAAENYTRRVLLEQALKARSDLVALGFDVTPRRGDAAGN